MTLMLVICNCGNSVIYSITVITSNICCCELCERRQFVCT